MYKKKIWGSISVQGHGLAKPPVTTSLPTIYSVAPYALSLPALVIALSSACKIGVYSEHDIYNALINNKIQIEYLSTSKKFNTVIVDSHFLAMQSIHQH